MIMIQIRIMTRGYETMEPRWACRRKTTHDERYIIGIKGHKRGRGESFLAISDGWRMVAARMKYTRQFLKTQYTYTYVRTCPRLAQPNASQSPVPLTSFVPMPRRPTLSVCTFAPSGIS